MPTPTQMMKMLREARDAGPHSAALHERLLMIRQGGCEYLSYGTWAPGHPKDTEEFAEHYAHMLAAGNYAVVEANSNIFRRVRFQAQQLRTMAKLDGMTVFELLRARVRRRIRRIFNW